MKKLLLPFLTLLLIVSCETESIEESGSNILLEKNLSKDALSLENNFITTKKLPKSLIRDLNFNLEDAVTPSDCGPTVFNDVINASIQSNIDALGLDWYSFYADINFYYMITDESEQYFGKKGQYTNYVVNRTRSLEKFWNMPDEVSVRGEHNETLNDKAKIISVLEFWYGFPTVLAEQYANYFVDEVNPTSTFLIETPLLSADGFAIALDGDFDQGDLIVIGDGIVELLSATGVEDKVVWSGILAHEWAHHIQFNNGFLAEYDNQFDNDPERTRAGELEADFIASYYLTHKRGATYNWKSIEGFLDLYFNIGDCQFGNPGHHGTPDQRMESSHLGYELAASAQKNGKILSQEDVHQAFLEVFDGIVAVP